MKTVQYETFGGVDVLQIQEVNKPVATNDQVLIQLKSVSINPLDWKIRNGEMKLMSGSKFPKNIGIDFSGIIEEVGSEVNHFKKGDEVFGSVDGMKAGVLGEYAAVSSKSIYKKPPTINFNQAASIPVVGFGALKALEKIGRTSSATEILINGATGGLGMFLIQLLKQQGAKVTTVSSKAGLAYAKSWGADNAIDYTSQNVLELGMLYDVVVDLSGKLDYSKAKQIMKSRSSFIDLIPQPQHILTAPIKNIFTGKKHKVVLSKPSENYIATLLEAINKGLKIEVSHVFQLTEFKEAFRFAEKGGVIGKVVIAV